MQALDKAPYDPENPYSSSLGEGISAQDNSQMGYDANLTPSRRSEYGDKGLESDSDDSSE